VKIGFFLKIVTTVVSVVSVNTFGKYMFNLGTFPNWAMDHSEVFRAGVNVTNLTFSLNGSATAHANFSVEF